MVYFQVLLFWGIILVILGLLALFLFLLWKKKRIAALVVFLLLIPSCVFMWIYLDGYYLPFKPCRPITYPEGQTIVKEISYTTQDSPEVVSQFFNEELGAKPADIVSVDGAWLKEEVAESVTLYWCRGRDINLSTGETGCIYVSPSGDGTHIRTEFQRWEGSSWLCSVFYE